MKHFENLFWLAPFIFLGTIALAPLRPCPDFPVPEPNRILTDADGGKFTIPIPFLAVIGYCGSDFLEITHAPGVLLKAGDSRYRSRFGGGIMSRIYPEVLKDDKLWNSLSDVETLLARDDGATYIVFGSEQLRRAGLSTLPHGWHPLSRDEMIFRSIRTVNEAMGTEEQGAGFINTYKQAYADLQQELQPETLTSRPRAIYMGSIAHDWNFLYVSGTKDSQYDGQDERAGVVNGAAGFEDTGRQQDAERILAMNPDIITVFSESVRDFLRDPRWQGLKAVSTNRVYTPLRSLRGSLEPLYGLDFRPHVARWMAELAHPDRLQPKLRELMRTRFINGYGYHLSDDEIDNLLRIEENHASAGYARFIRQNIAGNRQEPQR